MADITKAAVLNRQDMAVTYIQPDLTTDAAQKARQYQSRRVIDDAWSLWTTMVTSTFLQRCC